MTLEAIRTRLLSRVPRAAALKAIIWTVTVVASAWIGLVINAWWEAPRPHVELSTVELKQMGDPNTVVAVPTQVADLIMEHPYSIRLGEHPTIKDLREVVEGTTVGDATYKRKVEQINRLLDLLNTRPTTLPINDRRQEFLDVWSTGSESSVIDSIAKLVLQRSFDTLPPQYRTPRTGNYTRWVEVRTNAVMSLAEIDEEAQARSESSVRGAVNVYERVLRDARNTNLLRRAWAFMEPSVLGPMLKGVKEQLEVYIRLSDEIRSQLTMVLQSAQPERLVATTIITNRGGRPLAVRNLGMLWLRLPSQSGDREELIPISLGTSTVDTVTIVDAGNVKVLTLVSSKTAAELVDDHRILRGADEASGATRGKFESSRLRLLFDGGGISAAVSLARAGATPSDVLIGPTEFRLVGAKGDDAILRALETNTKP